MTSWCGYHSSVLTNQGWLAYTSMPYLPDAGPGGCGTNFVNQKNDRFGHGYLDGFSMVAGHEYAEVVTDPQVTGNPISTSVPYNGQWGWAEAVGAENGDKCVWSIQSTNVRFGRYTFAVQPLWSNAANSGLGDCVLSG